MHSQTATLVWSDSLLLGHQEMDSMHEEFVAWMAVLASSGSAALPEVLGSLECHARRHFAQEESWMRETDFPHSECHVNEHAAVRQSIAGVRRRVARGEHVAAKELAQALTEWFPAHADYLDSALVHWISQRRLGGIPVVLRRAHSRRVMKPTHQTLDPKQ